MIKPLGTNVLLKRKKNDNSLIIMLDEDSSNYTVINVGSLVKEDLLNKEVIVNDGLVEVSFQGEKYYLTDIKNILAVVEE